MSTHPYCPVHGDPDDILRAFPCPAEGEGDPPHTETCPHLLEYLVTQVNAINAGDYWELKRAPDRWIYHEYIAGRPTGVTREDIDDDEPGPDEDPEEAQ